MEKQCGGGTAAIVFLHLKASKERKSLETLSLVEQCRLHYPYKSPVLDMSDTYDHRVWKTGLPVRSAVLKPHAG